MPRPKDQNTVRILVVGSSLAGVSVVKPLMNLLKEDKFKETGKCYEICLLDPRRGLINSFAAPRSIIDPEFAKGTYCVFDQMNFPSKEDEDFKHITLTPLNGWCEEMHDHYCKIKTFEDNFYDLEFDYCVYSAGKSKKYPFTPNAYTKNSFIEEMYKTTSEISKARRVLVVGGTDVVGIETAALIKAKYPHIQVGLCFEDVDFPEFDPILFKNLIDLFNDNKEKRKALLAKQIREEQATSTGKTSTTDSNKDDKFIKQVFTRLRKMSISSKTNPSSRGTTSPVSPTLAPIKSTPSSSSPNHSHVVGEVKHDLSGASTHGLTSNDDEDPIVHFRHVLKNELIDLGVEVMPGVRPLRSIGFDEYCEESYTIDTNVVPPKLERYKSFDTYTDRSNMDTTDETDISSRGLITKDHKLIETDVLLWCMRDKPNTSSFKNSKLASCVSPLTNEVLVDKHGLVAPYKNLFAIGDCSNFDKVLSKNKIFDIPSPSMTVSGTIFVGRLVAHNIVRSLTGEELLTIHDFNKLFNEDDIDNGLIYNKQSASLYATLESKKGTHSPSSHHISPTESVNSTTGKVSNTVANAIEQKILHKHPLLHFPRFIVSLGLERCVSLNPEDLATYVNDTTDLNIINDFRCSLISKLLKVDFVKDS